MFSTLQSYSAIAVSNNPAAVCSGATCTVTFPFTGDYYAWTTPLTGNFTLEVWGAQGGVRSGGGGGGGYSKGTINISSGTTLYIYPGGNGAYNASGLSVGGFNGGGNSASGGEAQGGGGGATHIATSLGQLSTLSGNSSSVLIVAGGGGGSDNNSSGGTGGGTAGGTGTTNPTYNGTPGAGGTQSTGGCSSANATTCGSFGKGGLGGNSYGAGGGGGWYGGGGGWYDSGGGGGSGYLASSLTSTTSSNGVRSGSGQAVITYPNGPSVTSFTTTNLITNNSSITYSLIFSETISGLISGDFVLSGTGSSTCLISVSGSTNSYSINLSSCSSGTIILALSANSVTNNSSQIGPTGITTAATVTIDQTSPIISTVTAPSNATYKPVDTPTFTVAFSESITVTGTPRLTLTVGAITKYATYVSQTDSRTALFRYTVASSTSEFDIDGISISNSIDLNGGSIADLATNALSTLTFTAPNTSSIFVAQPPAAPTIDSATAGSGFIRLNFTAGSTYGSAITNYQYSTNNGLNWTVRSPIDTSTPLTISGLTNGTSYQVRIRAVSAIGTSDSSTSITATPNAVTVTGGSNISTTFGISDSSTAFTSTGGVGPYVYTLSSSVSGISISNGVVTTSSTLNAGTYSLDVVSTDTYLATGTKAITITVAKASQDTLTITSSTGVFTGNPSSLYLVTSGGSDIGTVTFTDAGGGTASGCTFSGSTLQVTSAGTCRIVATKAATTNFLIAYSETATITFAQYVYNQPVQTQSVPSQLPINGQNSLDLTQTTTVPAVTGVFLVNSTYEINGTGFSGVSRVVIGGADASIVSSTSTKIVIDSAGLMPGPLFIECSDGRIGPSPFYFFAP